MGLIDKGCVVVEKKPVVVVVQVVLPSPGLVSSPSFGYPLIAIGLIFSKSPGLDSFDLVPSFDPIQPGVQCGQFAHFCPDR